MHILLTLPGGYEWFLVLFVIAGFIFWIKMVVEIATSEFRDSTTKVVWLLITILSGLLGAAIYYFAGRSARMEKTFNEHI